jgi:hypothetical protein
MADESEGNKEGDASGMLALEGDWGRKPTPQRRWSKHTREGNGSKKDGCAAGNERAESDGAFKVAANAPTDS